MPRWIRATAASPDSTAGMKTAVPQEFAQHGTDRGLVIHHQNGAAMAAFNWKCDDLCHKFPRELICRTANRRFGSVHPQIFSQQIQAASDLEMLQTGQDLRSRQRLQPPLMSRGCILAGAAAAILAIESCAADAVRL